MSGPDAKFTVGAAPHRRRVTSLTRMNAAFLLALLPTALAGAVAHGFGSRDVEVSSALGPLRPLLEVGAQEMGVGSGTLWFGGILGLLVFGMGVGLLAEYACQVLRRQPYHVTNGHGVLMGLVLTLLCPPGVPLWLLGAGVVLAIFIGKQLFGGIGGYPMHPAMVGFLIVMLSWPHLLYPVGAASIGAANPAVITITLIGGLGLCLTGYARWQIPVGVLLGVAATTPLFGDALKGGVLDQIFTGHIVLMAFFIGTDTTTSPANRLAAFLYGLLLGALAMLIRAYGIWADAVPFAVMLANVMNPLLDRIRPKVVRVHTEVSR